MIKKENIKKIIESSCLIICLYILIDMLNIPTIILKKYNLYAIGLIFSLGIFILINRGFINLFKINVKNFIDECIVSNYIATLLYLVLSNLIFFTLFKVRILTVIFTILTVCIIYRMIQLYSTYRNREKVEENINVYDIRILYENKINSTSNDIIFLEENDVKYDLLNRSKIINDLYNSVSFCRNEKTFVISLTGEWGAGKTTIINIVKQQLEDSEYIIIDNFEPWQYNNEKSLFFAMFDRIMEQTGIKFSLVETKKFIDACSSILVSDIDTKVSILNNESKIVSNIKDIINDYLKTNNKRVVFIIDNIERAESNNILIILKTISNILNLDRFIYVLSYDEKEMRDIFKNKLQLNYDYIEKVIQLPLRVPKISKVDIVKICKQCMKNLLIHYGIEDDSIDSYMPAIDLFVKNIKNLREFKRKVNSIVNCNFYNKSYLNTMDAFLIELIEFENLKLYETIKENYKYFISEEKELIYGFEYQDAKEYNKEITEFFDEIFKNNENRKLIPILKLLFPNVKKYTDSRNNGQDRIEFRQEDSSYIVPRDKEIYKDSVINKRIFNGKFFELYFTRQSNAFIELDNRINDCINKINTKDYDFIEKEDWKELQSIVADLLFAYTAEDQKCLLETLQLYLDKITKNKLILLICLIEYQSFIDNRITFMGLSARKRLELICSEIIKELNKEDINKFKSIVEINYKNLYFIRGILYWLNPKDKYIVETNEELYNELNESYEKMLDNIVKNKINMYDDRIYSRHNFYCLLDKDRYKSQIKNINSKTLIRFLVDIMNESIGSKYGYRIDTDTLLKVKSYQEIDDIIKEVKKHNLNQKEEMVINIYEKSKNKEKGFDEDTLYSENYMDFERM